MRAKTLLRQLKGARLLTIASCGSTEGDAGGQHLSAVREREGESIGRVGSGVGCLSLRVSPSCIDAAPN